MLRAIVPVEITQLGPREVEIRMMTSALARDGHIVEPAGVVIDNYLKNPIQLWQHNPEFPVGCNQDLRIEDGGIVARTVFAPAGVSAKADEICGLVKNGIVRSVSIGFDALDAEPLDPKLGARGGLHITKWELLECSFVSIPADPGALVTARDLDGTGSRADGAD
jgi:HK97 family phage prohead protease